MQKIIYTDPKTGALHVVHPVENCGLTFEEIMAKDVPQGVTDAKAVDASTIPPDRTFRDAWIHGGDKPIVHMGKARDLHMARIRIMRNKELSRLDVEQLKGNDVAAQKQKLRDLPQTFDLSKAQSADELKALWPEGLPSFPV